MFCYARNNGIRDKRQSPSLIHLISSILWYREIRSSPFPAQRNWKIRIHYLAILMIILFSIGCSINYVETIQLATQGNSLTVNEVQQLEEKVKIKPDLLRVRIKLLGYYFTRYHYSKELQKSRQKHILWIIQNYPESEIAGTPYVSLNPIIDNGAYTRAANIWLSQIGKDSTNTAILGNTASFFMIYDKDLSEKLIKQAISLEPNNQKWQELLQELSNLKK